MTQRSELHPLVKAVLDGERSAADLPPGLRAQADQVLRLLAASEAVPDFEVGFDQRVMAKIRRRPRPRPAGLRAWLLEPREIRLRAPTWALATAALLLLAVGVWSVRTVAGPARAGLSDSVYVRFVLYAPQANRVALAGSFNQWQPSRAPLVPAGATGLWTTTVALPAGQHLYAFVVDGSQWVPDPAAPSVNDGFGHQNSVLVVSRGGAARL